MNKDLYIQRMTEYLPVLRTALGLSQQQLCEKIGFSRSSLAHIENGTRIMRWRTFLTLVLFFKIHSNTNQILNIFHIYDEELEIYLKNKENLSDLK